MAPKPYVVHCRIESLGNFIKWMYCAGGVFTSCWKLNKEFLPYLATPLLPFCFFLLFFWVNFLTDCLGREKSDLGPGSFFPFLFVGPLPSPF